MHRLHARLKGLYLAWFAKPAEWRVLFKHVRKHRPCKLLELGVGTGDRARRVIEASTVASFGSQISYTGIDLFETRTETDGAGLSLKLAHRMLAVTKAKVRLVPGDPWMALSASANALGRHDLILIASDQHPAALDKAWFYMPRLLGEGAAVFVESAHDRRWTQVSPEEIDRRAQQASPRRAA